MITTAPVRDSASFRDPDGFIFFSEDTVFRALTDEAQDRLDRHRRFYQASQDAGLMLKFQEDAGVDLSAFPDIAHAISPERLPLITYPHEWGFDQLKDAALNTLDINLMALDHGLTLKDASSFNNQRHQGKMVFIDHLSFEESDGRLPWRPYSQFCRHFLNPLVVASYRDMHVNELFRSYIDGLPQQLANDLLPVRAKFRPSVYFHMIMHNRYIRNAASFEGGRHQPRRESGKQVQLLKNLRAFIEGLEPSAGATLWNDYYEKTNYADSSFQEKIKLVNQLFSQRKFQRVWDLGGNDGTFSREIVKHCHEVITLDVDHNAINKAYRQNNRAGHLQIHSLVHDFANPPPNFGFAGRERSMLSERSHPDAIMALALIHHMSISNNVPFDLSAAFFREFDCDLIIEFVDRDDSQVQRLLHQKNVPYSWYNEENFIHSFGEYFDVLHQKKINSMHRTMFHLTPR